MFVGQEMVQAGPSLLLIKHYGLTYFYSYWLRYPIVDFKWTFIANDSYCLREKLGVQDYLMGKKVGA